MTIVIFSLLGQRILGVFSMAGPVSSISIGQRTRWALGASAVAGLGLAGVMLANAGQAAQAPPPPPVVTVAQPLVQSVPQWTEHAGRFAAAADVDVRPRVSGYLQRVMFQEGQVVHQGDLLFVIDPAPFSAAADKARADVAQAEAQRARAESEFARAETLLHLDAISQEEYEARREAAQAGVAAKLAAEAALRSAQLDLGYASVRAPITGRISDARIKAGNLVRAGDDVLTRIVSLDPIYFEFSAPESLLSATATNPGAGGQRRVLLQLEGENDFTHEGVLDFVDNAVDPHTGTLRGRATFANGGQYTPGQFGRIRIIAPQTAPSVLVPDTAVSADQSHRYVLVLNQQNVVQYRPVLLGAPVGDGLRVIRDGLRGDERVVVNGVQRAFPGSTVAPQPGRISPSAAREG